MSVWVHNDADVSMNVLTENIHTNTSKLFRKKHNPMSFSRTHESCVFFSPNHRNQISPIYVGGICVIIVVFDLFVITGSFRDIETTIFDPVIVFLSTYT